MFYLCVFFHASNNLPIRLRHVVNILKSICEFQSTVVKTRRGKPQIFTTAFALDCIRTIYIQFDLLLELSNAKTFYDNTKLLLKVRLKFTIDILKYICRFELDSITLKLVLKSPKSLYLHIWLILYELFEYNTPF